jgi:hypothetical protein
VSNGGFDVSGEETLSSANKQSVSLFKEAILWEFKINCFIPKIRV